jgi:hypothetical protein
MRSLSRIFAPLAIATGLFLSADTLRAATQTHIFNIPRTETDWNQLLTVPKFNPFNGTLTMVVVRITASFKSKVDIENLSASPTHVTATENLTANVVPTPAVQWNLDPISKFYMDTALLAANDGTSNYTGADAVRFTNEGKTELTRTFTSAADLAEFTLSGLSNTWDAAASGVGSSNVTAETENFQDKVSTKVGLIFKVMYCYDIVPEPGTCGLLALGLVLAGRRRRNRR